MMQAVILTDIGNALPKPLLFAFFVNLHFRLVRFLLHNIEFGSGNSMAIITDKAKQNAVDELLRLSGKLLRCVSTSQQGRPS